MCTLMYFLLLVKFYWCKIVYYDVALFDWPTIVYCDVAISDWIIGDNNCTNISDVSQMYRQFHFDCYSSVPINFDTLNGVFCEFK